MWCGACACHNRNAVYIVNKIVSQGVKCILRFGYSLFFVWFSTIYTWLSTDRYDVGCQRYIRDYYDVTVLFKLCKHPALRAWWLQLQMGRALQTENKRANKKKKVVKKAKGKRFNVCCDVVANGDCTAPIAIRFSFEVLWFSLLFLSPVFSSCDDTSYVSGTRDHNLSVFFFCMWINYVNAMMTILRNVKSVLYVELRSPIPQRLSINSLWEIHKLIQMNMKRILHILHI